MAACLGLEETICQLQARGFLVSSGDEVDPFSLVLTSDGSFGSCDSARLLQKPFRRRRLEAETEHGVTVHPSCPLTLST